MPCLHRRVVSVFALLVLCFAAQLVATQPASAQSGAGEPPVPAPLQPWVDWVMFDQQDLDCPQVDGATSGRLCVWPGTLEVEADQNGARFSMQVWLARRADVRIPGDNTYWPQKVQADGRAAIVKASGEHPVVELDAGEHRLSGVFEWASVPEILAAPPNAGRVSLNVAGADIDRPRLDADGRLWLQSGAGGGQKDEADRIRASIYRSLRDGSPMTIVTQLELNVSGKAREIELGEVLVDQSRASAVESPLPVKVNRDGRVSVYARPGTHQVTIEAIVAKDLHTITVPKPDPDFYDPQEVWVWQPNEVIRSVELSGLQTVDPARTSLPEGWRGHTTFLAEPGSALTLEVSRRGVTPSPNAIELDRTMWLDIDGDGFTIRDRLSGTLDRDWRLDYAGPAELGHVHNAGEGDDVLITKNPDTDHSGVELRQSKLNLVADLRIESSDKPLQAVGWDHDVQRLSTTLSLPPGWTLFAAGGVDRVDGTWIASWTLWDFFFVLMVALSIGKLLGWRWTPLAILALVVSHGHSDAPMWVWIHLIAALALLRALPDGRWRKAVYIYRAIALLVLFGVLANFAHDQVHAGLHPQVNSQAFRTGDSHGFTLGMADVEQERFANAEVQDQVTFGDEEKMEAAPQQQRMMKKGSSGSWSPTSAYVRKAKKLDLQQIDPKAIVQTGPGLPNWSWNSWRLRWNGPVHKEHEVDLWLVSPTLNRMLAFLRVALLIVLALLVLSVRDMVWNKDDDERGGADEDTTSSKKSIWRQLFHAGIVVLASVAVLGQAPEASAQSNNVGTSPGLSVPISTDMLDTLRQRMIAANNCDGVCVLVSRADIEVDGLQFKMRAEVHAQKDSGWHLPGPADALRIDSVQIDGRPSSELRREVGGLTAVRLPKGHHTVELSATLANRNVVTVQFNANTRPKLVRFGSAQWTVDGLSSAGVPDNSLQLTRKEDASAAASDGLQQAPELPPWYSVHRFVGLGLPWQLRTTVTRADASRPQLVKIGLIDGESVITDGLRVEGGEVLVDFPRGESEVEYVSELPIRERIELTAPGDQPWSETWTVECSRIWRCKLSDLPPVELVGEDDIYRPTWKPWPEETLTIDVERPEGAEGQSSTVENVDYRITPGERLLEASLRLTIRASQGGRQTLTLPEGAELQTTTIDDDERSLRLDERTLDLPVRPGEHTYFVKWQQPWERDFVERMPQVDIGSEAANVEMFIERSQDRWLLRTMGPDWGPAILFWARLVILLIIAVVLSFLGKQGRLRGLPLKLHEWVLLVIGMSQLPYLVLIPIVGWFAALELRRNRAPEAWWKFDFVQLCLVGLTIAAGVTLYAAVHTNLLINIDMQVSGANSHDHLLRWYVDRSGAELPTPGIVSVPLLVWRVLMLAWAFWLVSRLLKWVPWGWRAFSEGGFWRWKEATTASDNEEGEPPAANGNLRADGADGADGDDGADGAD
jgi:hypothetical protein